MGGEEAPVGGEEAPVRAERAWFLSLLSSLGKISVLTTPHSHLTQIFIIISIQQGFGNAFGKVDRECENGIRYAGMKHPLIALMTDFGEDDFFVASLKGTILMINPSARIIDITHRTGSFDPQMAGFILFSCYKYFSEGTIFLVIVDPGVGSSRKILLARTKSYFLIAPDNGLLTMTLEEEKALVLRSVENEKYFLPEGSTTFEGRDKMAPVAAHLSKGVPVEEFGPEVKEYTKLVVKKAVLGNNEISGHILYADKFGNLITNIPERLVKKLLESHRENTLSLTVKEVEIPRLKRNYSSVEKGEFLFLVGSLGFIEVAAREDSASQRLNARPGDPVKIVLKL